MIKSFLRASVRHLRGNRLYAGLNILGLSVGIACFAIIALWTKQQFSFDRMHEKIHRIFQVDAKVSEGTTRFSQAFTPAPLAHALANDLPEVGRTLRMDPNEAVVNYETEHFVESGIIAADPSFFDFFDFRLLKGNPATALSEPYSLVISERMAKKYFGDRDPINQALKIFQYDPDGKGAEYRITGIIQDCPANSHFQYSMIISFKTVEVAEPESLTEKGWRNNEYYTYVMLKPLTTASSMDGKVSALSQKYQAIGRDTQANRYEYFLTPLADIHFRTDIKYQIHAGMSMSYILIFGAIGLIVLILACINYINISNAHSIDQFSKVGIRKILGASNGQVVLQYLVESWLQAVVALFAALAWIELSRPLFESIFGAALDGLYSPSSLFLLFGIASLAGIVSGIYPAILLSSVSAIKVARGQFSKGLSAATTQKILVTLQYSITIVLITGILVVRKQLNYIQHKDLGFAKENLLLLSTNGSPEILPRYEGFANELMATPGVSALGRSNTGIGAGIDRSSATVETADGRRINTSVFTLRIDHNYMNTYRMSLIAGRNFIPGNSFDSLRGYIINEAAVGMYGYRNPQDAIGKFFSVEGRDGEVVGVVRDFHYATLRERVEPAAMFLLDGYFSRITVRISTDADQSKTLREIAHAWKKHFPESVFDFAFVDDRLQNAYASEDRFSKTFSIFSLISLTIASLGLFALVSYNVERRTKEIGIRKVLGGTVTGISTMLSLESTWLVVVASLLAMPVAWYIMDMWLQNFAYHVDMGVGIFLMAGLLNLGIALGTIASRTVRSALRNPVDSLRSQ